MNKVPTLSCMYRVNPHRIRKYGVKRFISLSEDERLSLVASWLANRRTGRPKGSKDAEKRFRIAPEKSMRTPIEERMRIERMMSLSAALK